MSQDNKATKKDAGEMKTQLETPETNKAGISKEQLLKNLEMIFQDADITQLKHTYHNLNTIYIRPKITYDTKIIIDSRLKRLIELGNKYSFSFSILAGGRVDTDKAGDFRVCIYLEGSLVSL